MRSLKRSKTSRHPCAARCSGAAFAVGGAWVAVMGRVAGGRWERRAGGASRRPRRPLRYRAVGASGKWPDRRQVLPVDEVIEDEGHQEHHRERERARRDEARDADAGAARPPPAAAPPVPRGRRGPRCTGSPSSRSACRRRSMPTVTSRYMLPPTTAASPRSPSGPSSGTRCRATRRPSALPANVMSQWRRGTPSVPAPIMNTANAIMPRPKRYGCHFAIFGNISSRRNSVGIRK